MDTVVAPASTGTVITDSDRHRGGFHHGLEGKDASFIAQLSTLGNLRDLTADILKNDKDLTCSIERNSGENKAMIKDALFETVKSVAFVRDEVREQGEKTRELVNQMAKERLQERLQDAKDEINLLKLKIAVPAIPA